MGERDAVLAAREQIQAKLRNLEGRERPIEMRFTPDDGWNHTSFLAFCCCYVQKPYRRQDQRRPTVLLMVIPSFANDILWPEFTKLTDAQMVWRNEATEWIIREETFGDGEEPALAELQDASHAIS